jgi:hypothetical protein
MRLGWAFYLGDIVSNKTLTEIIRESEFLAEVLLENGGELPPEYEASLDANQTQLIDKVDRYGAALDYLKSRQSYALSRLQEWQKIADQCDKAIDSLMERLHLAIARLETDQIHGAEYSFKLVQNPPKVDIEDEKLVPNEYFISETKTVTRIDKAGISLALKNGQFVPGAKIIRTSRLVSKPSQRKELTTTKFKEIQ